MSAISRYRFGHAMSELVRTLNVTHVKGKNVIEPDATESKYRVFLNVEEATPEEIATLKVKIVETNNDDGKTQKEGTVENDLTITHTTPVFPPEPTSNTATPFETITPIVLYKGEIVKADAPCFSILSL